MAQFYLLQGDITQVDADAIINSANNDLILGSGVSGAIRRVGGLEIQDECNQVGTIPLGVAAVTGAGKLRCRWIIHAAVLPLGLWADEKSVRNGMKNSLKLAGEKKVKSLAIPAVGAGAGAFPIDRCAEVVIGETMEFLRGETTIEAAVFVLFDEKTYQVFEEHFKRLLPETPVEAPPPDLPREYPAESPA